MQEKFRLDMNSLPEAGSYRVIFPEAQEGGRDGIYDVVLGGRILAPALAMLSAKEQQPQASEASRSPFIKNEGDRTWACESFDNNCNMGPFDNQATSFYHLSFLYNIFKDETFFRYPHLLRRAEQLRKGTGMGMGM